MILVSASSSYFTFAVPMREVSFVGYISLAWDPCSLQFTLNGLVFRSSGATLY